MGPLKELNDLEIEIYGFHFPIAKEEEQKYNELVEKAKNLEKEIVKECLEAIEHLKPLINNCSEIVDTVYLNTGAGILREILKGIIDKLQELDPQNDLFK
ncbi:hypothetical protein LCGC14_2161610 [marine sediment metagenome]|uniref:Uncharacterized protein n=1 Tax=marine sediment metagenome TaxID=412755 RepID=A0A0F9DSR9_9ZZZZ